MGSEALELALAVYREPTKRHALYDMALPDDIGLVMQLASAPQPLLGAVAAEVGESEHTVLEAARFYLQLALFHANADAYRVLGLACDATSKRIREHYRWLQRWLHPDRRGEDWESLFATRVNWAWSNLRNETTRRAYDEGRGQEPPAHSEAAPEAGRAPEWSLLSASHPRTNRASRIFIGVLLCSCAALLCMALLRGDGVPQEEAGARVSDAAPADAQTVSAGLPVFKPAAAQRHSLSDVSGGDRAGGSGTAPDDHAVTQHGGDVRRPASRDSAAATAPQPSIASEGIGSSTKSAASKAATEGSKAMDALDHHESTRDLRRASAMSQATLEPKSVSVAPEKVEERRVEQETRARPDVAVERQANERNSNVSLLPAEEAKQAPASPNDIPRSDRIAPVADISGTGVRVASPEDALARIDLAHQVVRKLSMFFSKSDSRLPPIWNDLTGQTSAEAQRTALFERAGLLDSADFVVDNPNWRMSEGAAALTARYHLLKRHAVSESGHLSLSMVWRERTWLVTRVELRPVL